MRFEVDREAVDRALEDVGSFEGGFLYCRLDIAFAEIESNVRSLIHLSLFGLWIAALVLFQPRQLAELPAEARWSLIFALYFVLLSLVDHGQIYLLRLLLPLLWTSFLKARLPQEQLSEEALSRLRLDVIRSHDWRVDLVLSRLQFGARHQLPEDDFRLEKLPHCSWRYPRLFFRRYIARTEVGVALLALAGMLSFQGFQYASLSILLLVFGYLVVSYLRQLLGMTLEFPVVRQSTSFIEAFSQPNCADSQIVQPSMSTIHQLLRSMRKKNDAAVAVFARQFFGEALQNVESYRRRQVLDDEILPMLEKVIGSPLPKALQQAFDSYLPIEE